MATKNKSRKGIGGRKKIDPSLKKVQTSLFLESGKVDKLGGIETVQRILLDYWHNLTAWIKNSSIDFQWVKPDSEENQKNLSFIFAQLK